MRAHRWSDSDTYWGPFTYARETYSAIAAVIESGSRDDCAGTRLRLSAGRRTLIMALPPIVHPWRRKVKFTDAELKTRLGRDWYYDTHRRAYGFSLTGSGRVGCHGVRYDFLQVFLGRQTHDSSTEQSWSKFLPWHSWRHVRHSLYGLDGAHFDDMPKGFFGDSWKERKAIETACPSATFAFTDFDGEALTAKTRIGEMEWLRGEGWFKWLSWFYRPMVSRSLGIEFSGEVGERKGSWKGGTTGHSIDMLPGELHEAAFRRYCAENRLGFVSEIGAFIRREDVHR